MQTVLITGGTSGIGLAICGAAGGSRISPGAYRAGCCAGAAATAEVLAAIYLAGDVTQADAWPDLLAQAAAHGDIAGLVTAAGQYREGLLAGRNPGAAGGTLRRQCLRHDICLSGGSASACAAREARWLWWRPMRR